MAERLSADYALACRAVAPIRTGDEGPNYCELTAGHDGDHICHPLEEPFDVRRFRPRRWAQNDGSVRHD